MTETTQTIFEKYQIRKNTKQKTAFIDYLKHLANEWGYSSRVEKGMLGARNIVIGDPAKAKVIYTAQRHVGHFDETPGPATDRFRR